jgi:hypothetical protein
MLSVRPSQTQKVGTIHAWNGSMKEPPKRAVVLYHKADFKLVRQDAAEI